jgi:glycosyltransferase involved in cell wall biosynthesis
MIDFTIAIPTFNGAFRLPLVLDRLREQIGLENYTWEVIVIDNNSTDNTRVVVEKYQENFPCELNYFYEPKQGAAHARQLAIRKARSELVGFLDDDNIPDFNWAKEVILFSHSHPGIGAFSSQIKGDFEVNPPENFKKISCFLAINNLGENPLIYSPKNKMLPPTAGLAVHRSVWLKHVPEKQFLSGPTTQINLNSEDLEVLLAIQKAGYKIWYNPLMKVSHKIPGDRLTRQGLLKTIRGTGLARHYIRMKRYDLWQRPFVFLISLLKDLCNLIFFYIKNFKLLGNDLVTDCQIEFLRSTVISPFYLWFVKK